MYKLMLEHHFTRSRFAKVMSYESFVILDTMLYESRKHKPTDMQWGLNTHISPTCKKPSKLLTNLICLHAKLQGHQLKSTNNTGTPIVDRRTKKVTGWRRSAAGAGNVLDISGTIFGESVEIEIKIGSDKLSPAQYTHIMDVVQKGGVAIVVKNYDEYIQQLNWIYDIENYRKWKAKQLDNYLKDSNTKA